MKKKPRFRILRWYFATLLIAATIAVPVFHITSPMLVRWEVIAKLDSEDSTERRWAIRTLVHSGESQPELVDAAIAKLDTKSDAVFFDLVKALQDIDRWRRPPVPASPWLRWVNGLATHEDTKARAHAATLLADMANMADDPRLVTPMSKLVIDKEMEVRLSALVHCAELAGSAKDQAPYARLIEQLTSDTDPTIARHAWIYVGLLNPKSGVIANWRDRPPAVAKAIIWAATKTNPDTPAPAIEALLDETIDPSIRAQAAYALHMSDKPEARDALIKIIDRDPKSITVKDQAIVWRAILSVHINGENKEDPAIAALARFLSKCTTDDLSENALLEPVLLAAIYRYPPLLLNSKITQSQNSLLMASDLPLVELAILEGTKPGSRKAMLIANQSDLIRVRACIASANPQPSMLMPAFDSEVPMMRDLACVVAAERFTKEQLNELITTLLKDFNDDNKRSGAIIAGLTNIQPRGRFGLGEQKDEVDLLEHVNGYANYHLKQVTRIALWMQGRLEGTTEDEFRFELDAMLARGDIPTTTVLLAMLHMKRPDALDYLINPREQERLSLIELFDKFRWWSVMNRYLPEDAPPFWVWGDPLIEQFQVDLLREWYLINRHRVYDRVGK